MVQYFYGSCYLESVCWHIFRYQISLFDYGHQKEKVFSIPNRKSALQIEKRTLSLERYKSLLITGTMATLLENYPTIWERKSKTKERSLITGQAREWLTVKCRVAWINLLKAKFTALRPAQRSVVIQSSVKTLAKQPAKHGRERRAL